MDTQTQRQTKAGSWWKEWAVQSMPLGPRVLRWKNAGEIQRRRDEMRALGLPEFRQGADMVAELQELAGYYEKLYPRNQRIWQAAGEMAAAQVGGAAAALELVERWGFVRGPDGRLQFPEWWQQMRLPTEYMDYYQERHPDADLVAAGIDPQRFHPLARLASDMVWMGYYFAKGALFNAGVSLLTSEVTNSIQALVKRVEHPASEPLPVWVIGISEDEVAALRRPEFTVVGFNLYFSPVMEKFIANGTVRQLEMGVDEAGQKRLVDPATGGPAQLERGKVYVCRTNVSEGLPVPDESGLCMTNEVLHHNDYAAQAQILREMNRVAKRVEGGGRGWVAGELFRVPEYPRVILGLNGLVGPAIWDAWVSLINGALCVEELQRRQQEWVDEGVKLTFRVVPTGLASAPSFVHRLVMCPTQTLICGY